MSEQAVRARAFASVRPPPASGRAVHVTRFATFTCFAALTRKRLPLFVVFALPAWNASNFGLATTRGATTRVVRVSVRLPGRLKLVPRNFTLTGTPGIERATLTRTERASGTPTFASRVPAAATVFVLLPTGLPLRRTVARQLLTVATTSRQPTVIAPFRSTSGLFTIPVSS